MSTKVKSLIAIGVIALMAIAVRFWWVNDAPRRQSLASLTLLDAALHSATNRVELLGLLILPAAVQSRTAPEQAEFIAKALNDEISPEGLAALKKHGAYGPLKKVFPAEAETWAGQANVNSDECVAFKLDRNGLRAEVVLLKSPSAAQGFRVVRVNNVKQMANLKSVTAEQKP